MVFSTHVQGIPCQCRITHFSPAVPMRVYGPSWDDADPPKPEELDYEILDRKGRPAAWLENKITPADRERIEVRAYDLIQGAIAEAEIEAAI
jgi:hypothetical protein